MSGKTEWTFRLHEMIESADLIEATLKTVSYETFKQDRILQLAMERSFEIIGEAARAIPKNIQEKHAEVEWAEIIGMRHKIVHDYLDVDLEILWGLYQNNFFNLREKLKAILAKEGLK